MATTTSPRLTMRIDAELKNWLEAEAKRRDRSASYLAKQAIKAMKEESEAKTQMIRDAITEADKGIFISEESMTTWFESLETENELSEPKANLFFQRT